MAFLTYSPKERRDFLKNDLSIEEDFKEEAENITQLGNLYRSLDEQEKNQQVSLLKSSETDRPIKSTILGISRNHLSTADTDAYYSQIVPVMAQKQVSPKGSRQSVKVTSSRDFS